MNVFESPMYKATGFRMPLLPKIIITTTAMMVGAAFMDRHVTPLVQRIERPRWNAKLIELEHAATSLASSSSGETIASLHKTVGIRSSSSTLGHGC
ncbi:hypothetical protein QFC22_001964 [Naganishia vaughanmartiniae]|uniref:Uncharacterized protein n=1 Tax=Naganishia vaughanmartiniae TaxID=1424756 RepID=A0ACC2XGL4_9TREE|nr:hypothetical protein QFC22_001964 [Naganishia vaughanmartiniae]